VRVLGSIKQSQHQIFINTSYGGCTSNKKLPAAFALEPMQRNYQAFISMLAENRVLYM